MQLLDATERHIVGGTTWEGFAEWSNDGGRIAFVRATPTGTILGGTLFVVGDSGGELVAVTKERGVTDRFFAWSPDDSMIGGCDPPPVVGPDVTA